jgi:hypothetical protein
MIHGYRGAGIWNDKHQDEGELNLGISSETGELWLLDKQPTPRILIADELLWTMVHHPEDVLPGVTLEWQPFPACDPPATCCQSCPYGPMVNKRECFYGSKLVIKAVERTLVYMIGEYVCDKNAWWAHWPD